MNRIDGCRRSGRADNKNTNLRWVQVGIEKNRFCRPGRASRGLESFFREAGADGGTLAGLEFRIGLADHVESALALDDLAIGVAAFGGSE